MAGWLAPALQLGGAVLGMIGGRRQEPQNQSIDFKRLRKEAQRAGFNPVTALQATGGQGFQRGFGSSMTNLELLGGAMGAAGDFFQATDPINRETRELENELLREQIGLARQDRIARQEGYGFGQVPRVSTTPGSYSVNSDPASGVVTPVNGERAGTGLMFGVHMDDPMQFEIGADAYRAAVDGRLYEYGRELIDRNVQDDTMEIVDVLAQAYNPMTHIRAYRDAWNTGMDAIRYHPPPLADGGRRYDVWKAQQNYPSGIRRPN